MRTTGFVASVAFGAVLAAGCATINVGSYIARDLDFARYQTYDWAPADALPTGDPRLDNNDFFIDQFQGAVEKQLAMKGFARAAEGQAADLLIHYHTSVSWRAEIDALDRSLGYGAAGEYMPAVKAFEEGTLVLDVIDARTKRMVWRGWAEDRFEGAFDTQEGMERTVERAVRELMKRFPG